MTVSNAANPVAFPASFRPVFQRLFERASEIASRALNANERANADVKALEIFRLERLLSPPSFERDAASSNDATLADWRLRVANALEAVRQSIAKVESRTERAYLSRLALDAALVLNAFDATFFTESTADALLAEIDDAEERQNALVAYSKRLAARIARFHLSDAPERAKAFALIDEIEDLRFYEEAASAVVAAVLFDATRRDDAPLLVAASNQDDATLDLTSFGEDVANAWEQFESPGGFLELCEQAALDLFVFSSAERAVAPLPQEIALRQEFNAETRRRLEEIETALASNVDLEGAPLNDDVRDELQNVVAKAIIASPFALKNGEFFRAFLERSRNLDAYFPIFERLNEAQKAVAATTNKVSDAANANDANDYLHSFYCDDADFYAVEKTRWLESARRAAARSSLSPGNLTAKLNILTTSAELELRFGDKTVGKTVVRELLGLLPRLDSPFERAQIYRRLVVSHLESSYPKAAQKLASLWKAEMDAIEPEDFRDAALGDAFDLYAQAIKQDATSASNYLKVVEAPLIRIVCEISLQFARLFSPSESSVEIDVAQIASVVDATFASLPTSNETTPDETVFALVKIATALANRLNVVSCDIFG